jgi:hypothetical protein
MKFKYFSSDFLSSYNQLLDELETRQAELDTEYADRIEELVSVEKKRLEETVLQKYQIGQEVKILGTGKKGTIVSTHIEFGVEIEESDDYGKPHYGPGRYFSLKNRNEEEVVSCEGAFRAYVIETDAGDIGADWGVSKISETFFEEDLSIE